jgi:hypothetical protein
MIARLTGNETIAKEARLGDIVATFDGPYNAATVKKIGDDGTVHLFRPYIHFDEDTSIAFIGIEEYFVWPNTPIRIIRRV